MGYAVLAQTSVGDAALTTRWLVALAAALVAACCDAKTRRIPNLLTAPLFLAGFAVAGAIGGWAGLGDAAAGALLLGIPYFLLFALAGGGAGDAKMLAALGAWVGWHGGIALLVAVAVSGGILAIAFALWNKRLGTVTGHLRTTAFGLGLLALHGQPLKGAKDFLPAPAAMLTMPYGLAIFVGTAGAAGWVLLWH